MEILDNGGRRLRIERRLLCLPIKDPDIRSDSDRRSGFDRRNGLERRSPQGFREIFGIDRRRWFKKNYMGAWLH